MFLLKRLAPYMLLAFGLGAFFFWFWNVAATHGREQVQAEWNKDKLVRQNQIDNLKIEYATKEEDHAAENRRISTQLAQVHESHALALAAVRTDFDGRMRQSENRSLVYKRQAESGAAECRDLAIHAAKLDSALEEGRSLEQEYRITLGQRDEEIRALSSQILNDRKLLN